MPKILLIEDDKDLATVVHDWLKSEYYSLELAADGTTGYEYLRQGDYDLVILDWDLPTIDNWGAILQSYYESEQHQTLAADPRYHQAKKLELLNNIESCKAHNLCTETPTYSVARRNLGL